MAKKESDKKRTTNQTKKQQIIKQK